MHVSLHRLMMRLAGRTFAVLLRSGVSLGPIMLLTVAGRRTGQPRTTPVDVFEHDGRRWLVSTHGVGDANWVRNLRAAGEGTLHRGHEHLAFVATELSMDDAARVLRDVVGLRLAQPVGGFILRQTLGLNGSSTA